MSQANETHTSSKKGINKVNFLFNFKTMSKPSVFKAVHLEIEFP